MEQGEVFYEGDIISLKKKAIILGYDSYSNNLIIEYAHEADKVARTFMWPAYIDPFNIKEPDMAYQLPGFAQKYNDESDIMYDVKRGGIYYMYEEGDNFKNDGIFYLDPVYPLDGGKPPKIQMQAKLTPISIQMADKFSGMEVDGSIIKGEISCIFSKYSDGHYSEHQALYSNDGNRTIRLSLMDGAIAFVLPKYFTKQSTT